jgi:hypothetical protein
VTGHVSRRVENVVLAALFIGGCVGFAILLDSSNPPRWWGVLACVVAVLFPVAWWAGRKP